MSDSPNTEKVKRPGRPRGRRATTRSNGDTTRNKIMDAAEVLFGERGFDTVSLRDITNAADVTLALASYHFGTKEKLFGAVVARRADLLNQMRRTKLAEIEAKGELNTETIMDAFMRPLFDQMGSGDESWQSYLLLLSKLGQSNRWLYLLRDNFDETANLFVDRLAGVLPKVSRPELLRGFSLSLLAMLQTVSKNRRIDSLSQGDISSEDLDEGYQTLLTFVTKGLEGLSAE